MRSSNEKVKKSRFLSSHFMLNFQSAYFPAGFQLSSNKRETDKTRDRPGTGNYTWNSVRKFCLTYFHFTVK